MNYSPFARFLSYAEAMALCCVLPYIWLLRYKDCYIDCHVCNVCMNNQVILSEDRAFLLVLIQNLSLIKAYNSRATSQPSSTPDILVEDCSDFLLSYIISCQMWDRNLFYGQRTTSSENVVHQKF